MRAMDAEPPPQAAPPAAVSADRAAPALSVVVPIGRDEPEGDLLLADLAAQLPAEAEVLLSATGPGEPFAPEAGTVRRIAARPGRAAQMNDAARLARGAFLWFLHADTRLPPDAVAALLNRLAAEPDALHYFGLRFGDGPRRLRLNELGVRFRCGAFRLPFGDQGFCLARESFFRLGGFDESAPYGEDHLLVWAAKRHGLPVRRVPATLTTSGRKYARHGWAQTTLRHVRLTLRQALPEAVRLLRGRRVR